MATEDNFFDFTKLSNEELISQFTEIAATLLTRLLARPASSSSSIDVTADGDRLFNVKQASDLLTVTKGWLYRNGRDLDLVAQLGDGTVRYSQRAILDYIKRSRKKSHEPRPPKKARKSASKSHQRSR